MTEAAHQMASQSAAARRTRKPGSVGLRRRTRGRDHGRGRRPAAAPGTAGEVVIRGPNVTRGYENNPARQRDGLRRSAGSAPATRAYSTPTAISASPAASRRSSTAAARRSRRARSTRCCWTTRRSRRPSPSPCRTTSWARRSPPPWCCARARRRPSARSAAFARPALADFKVPRKIVILAEIPKGATGKLQRIGLARSSASD